MKPIIDCNGQTEFALLNWISEEREFVDIPDELLFDDQARGAYREIRQRYHETGEINRALWSSDTRAVVDEGLNYQQTAKPDPMVKELRRLWERRRVRELVSRFEIDHNDSHRDAVAKLIKDLSSTLIEDVDAYQHERSVWETIDYINEAKKNGRNMLGISTNLENLDKLINGWQKGKTYIVGGLEKMGKSRLCIEIVSAWLAKGIGGIIFSMEMSAHDIHECILANRAIVDTAKMGTDNITDDNIYKLTQAASRYMNEPLYISTRSAVDSDYIRSVIRKYKIVFGSKGHAVAWVVVDYIQRMVEGDDRAGKLEDVAKSLADIARDENVIMIVISQVNQEAERNTGNLSPHQFIKGSKGIREAADGIIVLYKANGDVLAYVVQRKGKSNVSVRMIPQLEYSRFRDEKAE